MRFEDIVFVYHLRDERQIAWHGRRHAHREGEYELHYFISGEGSFRNGSGTWTIRPGSLHMTPPGSVHQILATNLRKPITYFAVLFSASGDQELFGLLDRAVDAMARPVDIGTSHRFFFADLLERSSSGHADLVEASRHSFLSFLYGLVAGAPSSYGAPENSHVEKAIAIMQASIEDNLDLDSLSGRLGVSREHLVRVFAQRMRMPPMRYYSRLKIEAARAMLSSTNLGIGTISEKLGYENQFGFSRAFKNVVGFSPTEYRARCLQKADFAHS
ncbi:MAG TPA: AraC family transcriptional regulator [Spirochaetia bacterium]|nr:AraC family transcriptional regulator [Spirochaetales bacterium]HRY79208.1 AraC family transcriptional regulator [Spirochaetia bacterium]